MSPPIALGQAELDVLRSLHLPTHGECRFVPPRNWSANQPLPRGERNGYVDRSGREWVKGRSVTKGEYFEWDVQLPHGHLNVDWSGSITHPKR